MRILNLSDEHADSISKVQKITICHKSEDHNQKIRGRENLKTSTVTSWLLRGITSHKASVLNKINYSEPRIHNPYKNEALIFLYKYTLTVTTLQLSFTRYILT